MMVLHDNFCYLLKVSHLSKHQVYIQLLFTFSPALVIAFHSFPVEGYSELIKKNKEKIADKNDEIEVL